jgi:hypothetical protein
MPILHLRCKIYPPRRPDDPFGRTKGCTFFRGTFAWRNRHTAICCQICLQHYRLMERSKVS